MLDSLEDRGALIKMENMEELLKVEDISSFEYSTTNSLFKT